MTKRALTKRDPARQTLSVSVSTVAACVDAVPPQPGGPFATSSLTFRGELTVIRKPKRSTVVIVRRGYYGMPIGGRVFPEGRVLNVLINLPPTLFTDVLTLALAGEIAAVEVTTEKLKADTGDVLGVRFATGEIRSTAASSTAIRLTRALPKSSNAKSGTGPFSLKRDQP